MVFNEIWNHLKTRATRRINKLVSEVITLLSLSIHCVSLSILQIDRYPTLRLQFMTPVHSIISPIILHALSNPQRFHPVALAVTLSGWRLLFSPAFSMFHSSSPAVVVIVSFAPLSLSVSIFACVLGLSAHHRRDHIPFHRFFSDPSKLALVSHHPDRLVPW